MITPLVKRGLARLLSGEDMMHLLPREREAINKIYGKGLIIKGKKIILSKEIAYKIFKVKE